MVNSIHYTNLLNTTPETMVDVGHVFFLADGIGNPPEKDGHVSNASLFLSEYKPFYFVLGGYFIYIYVCVCSNPEEISLYCEEPTDIN